VMHSKEAALGFMAFMDSLLKQERNTFGYKTK